VVGGLHHQLRDPVGFFTPSSAPTAPARAVGPCMTQRRAGPLLPRWERPPYRRSCPRDRPRPVHARDRRVERVHAFLHAPDGELDRLQAVARRDGHGATPSAPTRLRQGGRGRRRSEQLPLDKVIRLQRSDVAPVMPSRYRIASRPMAEMDVCAASRGLGLHGRRCRAAFCSISRFICPVADRDHLIERTFSRCASSSRMSACAPHDDGSDHPAGENAALDSSVLLQAKSIPRRFCSAYRRHREAARDHAVRYPSAGARARASPRLPSAKARAAS